jgi:predicted nucleotidyltransferase
VSINEELRQVIEMLVSKYEVYGVVLFGSRARGYYKP